MTRGLKIALGLLLFMVISSIIGDALSKLESNTRPEPSLAEIIRRAEKHIPRVEKASAAQRQRIQDTTYQLYRVRAAYALKASTHEQAFYVAARMSGPMVGYDSQGIGVWLVEGTKDTPGAVLSLNRPARRFSSAPVSKEAVRETIPKNPEARAVAMAVESELKR